MLEVQQKMIKIRVSVQMNEIRRMTCCFLKYRNDLNATFKEFDSVRNKQGSVLIFTSLWANSAEDKMTTIFLFLQTTGFDIP